ncbi:MFS transporter [Nocardiopsis kunsanensis]|uniref:MFS transporter n=1 Tax=Nocardiopsis kunsanensis TaxID=141693 RepID=UPI00036A854E|nr:MFS transporter [Nocardiopsis kunsanensis]
MNAQSRPAPPRYLPALLVVALVGTIIEIDMSVPSFPDIGRTFDVSGAVVQLTITLNFLGYCLGALVYGPISDRFGRRRVILAGNTIMLLGALGCAVAPTIDFLLAARFLQGIGAAASVVLVFVIISDVYPEARAMALFGVTNAAMSIMMTVAPPLGGFINLTIGWRGNYAVVFAITALSLLLMFLFLPESKHDTVGRLGLRDVLGGYRRLLGSWLFVVTSLVPSLLFASYMVFIASSSFLYTSAFGLSTPWFAAHLLVIVASFAIPSMFATKLIPVLGGPETTIRVSIGCALGGVVLFLLLGHGPVSTTVSIALFCVGFAVCYPVVFGRSMEVIPELGGAASSLTMSSRALLVTLLTGISSALFTGSPVVPASVMLGAVLIAAPLALAGRKLLDAHHANVPSSEADLASGNSEKGE